MSLIDKLRSALGQHQAPKKGVNVSGGGLSLQSMPGLSPTQAPQQGANVNGQGLSLESMPGLRNPSQGLNVAGQGLSLQAMPGLNFHQQSVGGGLHGDTGMQASNPSLQGGAFNPGNISLQDSMGIPKPQGGPDVHWQNTDGRLRNMINPQLSDTGYRWNDY